MNDPIDLPTGDKVYPRFTSLDVEELVIDQPGDMTMGPIPPELLPWAEYERDRINNPTKPASMPRPSTRSPAPAKPVD